MFQFTFLHVSLFLQLRNFPFPIGLQFSAERISRMWTSYYCTMARLKNNALFVYLPFGLFSVPKGPQLQKCPLPAFGQDITVTDYHNAQ